MKTLVRNLHIEAATTYRRTLRFFVDKERTTPLDLTGYVMAMWIWRGSDKIEFTVTIIDAEEGIAEILLEPEQTIDLLPGSYKHDLMIRDAGGDVAKFLKGTTTIYETGTKLPNE